MRQIKIPYAKEHLLLEVEEERLKAVLEPNPDSDSSSDPDRDEASIVRRALAEPVESRRLSDLAAAAAHVLLITSDHTRPVPSAITIPILLEEIRRNNPAVQIKILVATGCHRPTRPEELLGKFGETVFHQEDIVIHDSRDRAHLIDKGRLPSGGELWVNDLVDWADLVVAEGFIEPHFFAGFSGGRKSILPGICAAETVLANHCAEFIASPQARTGNLEGNPLHRDMLFAAQAAGLAFILNVALDADKKIINAFAGHPDLAHRKGCDWIGKRALVRRREADIVVTSNGGYPLDQNIYQSVKGMTAGEACVREGGVIIIAAACEDGHGGEAFFRWFSEAASPTEVAAKIAMIGRQDTRPDQWQAQILARVLGRCAVIIVTDRCDPQIIRAMHMQQAHDFTEALVMARSIVGSRADLVVIPDGVSVIVGD
ncbi:MAG: nickel-dependent lactate racemase [Clostridiaceae bacterium]|nr:nickel-dependent lactate racemase [Clostridiaceae bacterium]